MGKYQRTADSWNSGHQIWQQMLLSTESSCWLASHRTFKSTADMRMSFKKCLFTHKKIQSKIITQKS